ncbi:SDR family oxidoreductase [Streptomyces sp. NPDC002896]|uniref:SDR family NAD(P)-dependent oxidoreductase n=1 Tax=Streptomyces sp. NPDC002896 TaxID=3154438 RepID=UPI003319AFD5
MRNEFAGKSALVTGGAGGFGRGCALELARGGAAVTLMGRTSASLERSRERILDAVPDASIELYTGDATKASDVEAALDAATAHAGAIDVVIGTVGGGSYVSVVELGLADFMNDLLVNVGTAMLAVSLATPRMAPGGSFVFISSTAAQLSFPRLSAYCAGKAALDHFVRVAADELGPRGIRVNTVRPGLTATDGLQAALSRPGYVDGFTPLIPLGRIGQPEDIVRTVAFLAGPSAAWITGQSIAVDGGNELRGAPHPA